VLSSQIEGTQSSLSDLLLYENAETPGVPEDDVREVSKYVSALKYGLKRLKTMHELLKKRCVLSVTTVCSELGVSFPSAIKTLAHLQGLGFVGEVSGRRRHRVFSYVPYLKALQAGMGGLPG